MQQLPLFYCSPNHLQSKIRAFRQETGLADLLTLAEITSKYHFSSTEKLLVEIFQNHVRANAQRLHENATADTLKRALRVAILQNEENIQRDIPNSKPPDKRASLAKMAETQHLLYMVFGPVSSGLS
jgi:hypothetical protein